VAKPFYDFGSAPFRDELLAAFVLPAARWFLRDESSQYLLPQASGSNWECSLAIDFLLHVATADTLPEGLRDEIDQKSLATVSWLLTQMTKEGPSAASWDGVSWDTAVCVRTLLRVRQRYEAQLDSDLTKKIDRSIDQAVNWLVVESLHWDTEQRYAGGPPDLAQVLHTLIVVGDERRELLLSAELAAGVAEQESVIDQIARILLAMEERDRISTASGDVDVSFWVDAFNSSEVLEGLAMYLKHCESPRAWGTTRHRDDCMAAVYRCLRFIELNQSDGTWGGVADTCGTLYGYLRVLSMLRDVGHEDHVVFKALRWMCDEKQAMADGSFLHTSYVTVFYALALWQAYETWPLAGKRGAEVYDIALWNTPANTTAERSLRLEIQISLEDAQRALRTLQASRAHQQRLVAAALVSLISVLIATAVLIGSHSLTVHGNLHGSIRKADLFWAIVAVAVPVTSSAVGATMAVLRSRADTTVDGSSRRRSRRTIGRRIRRR